MSKQRIFMSCVVVALAIGADVPSTLAISFQYHVNGSALPSGSSKEYDVNTDGHVTELLMTVSGTKSELLSNKIKVVSGAKIFGGVPGTNEETVEFESVIVDKPAKCAVENEKVTTAPLKSEIVEGASSKTGNGEVDILFTPKTGTVFATINFVNKGTEECIFKGQKPAFTGSILGLSLPQAAEATNNDLDYEANTKEYKNSAGAFNTVGLKFEGEPATLTGLTLRLLVSKEKFGAF